MLKGPLVGLAGEDLLHSTIRVGLPQGVWCHGQLIRYEGRVLALIITLAELYV